MEIVKLKGSYQLAHMRATAAPTEENLAVLAAAEEAYKAALESVKAVLVPAIDADGEPVTVGLQKKLVVEEPAKDIAPVETPAPAAVPTVPEAGTETPAVPVEPGAPAEPAEPAAPAEPKQKKTE